MVGHQLPKLRMRVRFPSPAPNSRMHEIVYQLCIFAPSGVGHMVDKQFYAWILVSLRHVNTKRAGLLASGVVCHHARVALDTLLVFD